MAPTSPPLRAEPFTASPHLRHQSSLETIANFSTQAPLEPAQYLSADRRFNQIVNHFDGSNNRINREYNRVKLVRLTYKYACSEESKSNFLRAFVEFMTLPLDGDDVIDLSDADLEARLCTSLFNFAEYLFDNFFLPLKTSTKKTPQPSPAAHSTVLRAQGEEYSFTGTLQRVSTLRGACLTRDRHCCVISRKFDQTEARKRMREDGDNARNDNGVLLKGQAHDFLEVAHILPHSLTQVKGESQLNPPMQAALAILIEGTDIDRPRNAITLTLNLHRWFGDFDIFFEPIGEQEHTTLRPSSQKGS